MGFNAMHDEYSLGCPDLQRCILGDSTVLAAFIDSNAENAE